MKREVNRMRLTARLSAVRKNITGKIKDGLYAFSCLLYNKFSRNKKTSVKASDNRERAFVYLMLAFPIAIFLIGYVAVNINSIILAFKKYTVIDGRAHYQWYGIANFKQVISDLLSDKLINKMLIRSFAVYLITLLVAFPMQVLVSYAIYKKIPLWSFFQVVLFLPSIVSSIVIALMFSNFVESLIPELLGKIGVHNINNLLTDYKTAFPMQVFYCLWISFGANMILYLGAMSRIPTSIMEYGELEGISLWKEFWTVIVPLIFSTIEVFLITGIASIFSNQLALFAFFGTGAPKDIHTIGYFFFQQVVNKDATLANYPYAAAGGLVFTFIAAPTTLLVRALLKKINPQVEL